MRTSGKVGGTGNGGKRDAGGGKAASRRTRALVGARAGAASPGAPSRPATGGHAAGKAKHKAPARPAVVVDPRMRSRRIGVRRAAARRRLRRATQVLAAVAALVVALAATRSSLLDVDRVRVTGNHRTAVGDVLAAAGIDRGRPMVSVDTAAAARRVERLPWVGRVRVGLSWPATVTIRVTERTPVAAVKITDQQSAVVDAAGRVLAIEPASAAPAAGTYALVITGVDGTIAEGGRLPPGARDALAIAVAVRQRLPGAVASVGTNRDLKLTEGGVVRFGSAGQLQDKVTALQTVLDRVDTHCLRTLDVQVPGSPALTRNQGCS